MASASNFSARLRVGAALTLVAAIALLAFASSAQAAPRDFFGVMPQTTLTDEDVERMNQAHAGSLRFEIPWDHVDPSAAPGDYTLAAIDDTMRKLAENNIRAIPFLYGTPDWVAELENSDCSGDICRIYAPHTGAGLAAWKTFVSDMVKRYGPGGAFWSENPSVPEKPVKVWQIWNEQNSDSFYGPKPNVKNYAKLLDAADSAIASEDPQADVLLGGMFISPRGGRKPSIFSNKFLAKLYTIKGAKKDFDGVGIHPYAGQMKKVIAQTELMIDAMKDARDTSASTWITEIGWASSGPPNPLVKGSKGQADRLKEAFKYFLKNRRKFNTKAVVWYSWRDNPDPDVGLCEWCPGSGLVTEDMKAKPSLKQFTKFSGGS
jgi:hypothetical protein